MTTDERQIDLRVCPWRYRRVAIDGMYEVSALLMKRAEASFPADSIRAHLWAHNGRKAIDRLIHAKKGNQGGGGIEGEVKIGFLPPMGNTAVAVERESVSFSFKMHTTKTAKQRLTVSPLSLFLMDLQLEEYAAQFANAGFKTVDDFAGLSLDDCKEYFPFLKPGDLRRLSKQSVQISSDLCDSYENRALVGEMKPPPLPLPPSL